MNNYNCLKVKFEDIEVGTWFTYKGDHFFKITEIGEWDDGRCYPMNAVHMDGAWAGMLATFKDDDQVYEGNI